MSWTKTKKRIDESRLNNKDELMGKTISQILYFGEHNYIKFTDNSWTIIGIEEQVDCVDEVKVLHGDYFWPNSWYLRQLGLITEKEWLEEHDYEQQQKELEERREYERLKEIYGE